MRILLIITLLFGIFGLVPIATVHPTFSLPQSSTSSLGTQALQTEDALHLLATIPAQTEWIDCGTILAAGAAEEWDTSLWGGFANGIVKKDNTYFLYYQGGREYDDAADTVTWRAIGVATSKNGIHFTKYEHNPVVSYFPNNHLVEGAVSSGVFLDENGDIAMYYGANTRVTGSQVNADGRLATSSDGFTFTDQGIVLDHTDSSIWGAGDQFYPIIGIQNAGRWLTYYIPDGTPQRGQLGVAWGSRRDDLVNSSAAKEGISTISVWGSGSSVRLEGETYALFLNNLFTAGGPVIEVRTVSLSDPSSLSAPVQRYQFDDVQQATFLLDQERDTWFMYYRSSKDGQYGAKVAPAAGQAVTCSLPSLPPGTSTPTPPSTSTPLPSTTTTTPGNPPGGSGGTPIATGTPGNGQTPEPNQTPTPNATVRAEGKNNIFLPKIRNSPTGQ